MTATIPGVREVFESLGNRRLPDVLLTTNHVVGETITLARVRGATSSRSR